MHSLLDPRNLIILLLVGGGIFFLIMRNKLIVNNPNVLVEEKDHSETIFIILGVALILIGLSIIVPKRKYGAFKF